MVRVKIVSDEFQAELACSALRANEIPCMHRRTALGGLDWGEVNVGAAGSREILVPPDRLDDARAVLDGYPEAADDAPSAASSDPGAESALRARQQQIRLRFGLIALVVFGVPITAGLVLQLVNAVRAGAE